MRTYLTALARLAVVGMLLAGCATGGVRFPTAEGTTTLQATLSKPHGPGQFPAVVMMHGCAGIRSFYASYAKTLTDQGYVTLLVDSFTPRGINQICADNQTMARMARGQRVDDAYGALRYLKTLPFVDVDRVALMGWSHGGWTTLEALSSDRYKDSADQFTAGIATYPYCRAAQGQEFRFRAPLLILIGERDDWTPAKLLPGARTGPRPGVLAAHRSRLPWRIPRLR